jgi:cytochrome c biogenesis protein CcmG/thiol:disulfide interchange protein DsbE
MKLRFLLPLLLFLVLVVFLGVGLQRDPREVPSPLIGQSAPAFTAPTLDRPDRVFASQDLLGHVWVFNVWASWCAPCRQEHPQLMALQRAGVARLVGLNYKDKPQDAQRMLLRDGDPFDVNVIDTDGKVGINYGVYGVPETYVVDAKGVIQLKHTGPITPADLEKKILPLIARLKRS